MPNVITGLQAMAAAAALAKAGGKWTPVFRQPADPNGIPMGGPQRVGCMLGVRYVRGQMSAITIDIPGVIVRPDTPRFEGVLANGCEPPMQGDTICIDGKQVRVMDVMAQAKPLYVLTLEP